MQIRDKKAWIILSAIGLLGLGLAVYLIARPARAAHHYQAALDAIEKRDFQQASRHLDQFLELRPDDLDARLLAAQTARRNGDFIEAGRHLQQYRMAKGSVQALRREHLLREAQSGNLTAAEELLASRPDQLDAAETHLILEAVIVGRVLILQQQHDLGADFHEPARAEHLATTLRAVERWLQVRTAIPDRVQGLVWRGKVHAVAGRHADAVADFRNALELDADHLEAHLFLAWAVAEKMPGEAADHLEHIRQSHPDHVQAKFFLAKVRRGLGQLDEARELLLDLLHKDPDDVAYLSECGQVELDLEKPEEAEPLLHKALAIAPNNHEIHLALSRAFLREGKPDQAKWHADRARELEEQRKREH